MNLLPTWIKSSKPGRSDEPATPEHHGESLTFNEWLRAEGWNPAKVNDEQRATLEAAFKAEQKADGPADVAFTATVDLRAAADGENKRPTFSISAYNGGPLRLAGFPHPVVVDLAGLTAERERLPILFQHDPGKPVGHSTSVRITADGVTIVGIVTGDDADAMRVVAHAKNGFEWQASIGARIEKREFVDYGQTVTVNGRSVKGPAIIARKAKLYETSFVAIGADESSSAAIAAQRNRENGQMPQATTAPNETQRVRDIVRASREFTETHGVDTEGNKIDDLVDHAIEAGWSADQYELAAVRASRHNAGPLIRTGGIDPHGPAAREAIEAAILRRSGINVEAAGYSDRVLEHADRLGSPSLPDVAAMALRLECRDVPHDRRDVIEAAFSTLSLPQILGNVANKSLLSGYRESPPTWQAFAATRDVKDFKSNTALRPSFTSNLTPVAPDGKLTHGSVDEDGIEYRVDQFGQVIGITRVHLQNDDLNAFAEVLPGLGRSASRTLADNVWATILGAGAHFDAGNKNLGEAGSALSIESLAAGLAAIRTQRDTKGNDLDLQPKVLAVSPELEATARGILSSTQVLGSSGPAGNPVQNAVELAVEPRLSNTTKFSSASSSGWYLFCGPVDVPVVVAYLEGRRNPTLEQQEAPFDTLGRQFRVVFDFGSAMGDSRAAYKATGAAAA